MIHVEANSVSNLQEASPQDNSRTTKGLNRSPLVLCNGLPAAFLLYGLIVHLLQSSQLYLPDVNSTYFLDEIEDESCPLQVTGSSVYNVPCRFNLQEKAWLRQDKNALREDMRKPNFRENKQTPLKRILIIQGRLGFLFIYEA